MYFISKSKDISHMYIYNKIKIYYSFILKSVSPLDIPLDIKVGYFITLLLAKPKY